MLTAAALLFGCSGSTSVEVEVDAHLGELSSELTRGTAATLWDPAVPIDACFLADGTDLPTHEEWIRSDINRSWEYATDITVNWLSSCPATGYLVRIGLTGRTDPALGEAGWAAGIGMGAQRDERATTASNAGSPTDEKPSFKLYLQSDPEDSSRQRVAYLAIHEFGHILGFAHEQDHPDSTCSNGQGSAQTAVTDYDALSIMNYCSDATDLSALDILGAQGLYGVGSRYQAGYEAASGWLTSSSLLL